MVFLLRSSRCQIICSDALLKQRWVGIQQSSLRLLKLTASQQVKWNSTSSSSSHHHVDDDIAPSTSSSATHIQQQRSISSDDQQLAQSSARTRVAVAMSGGVDSSVAAYLLQQMSKSSSSHQLFVDGSNNTSISVNKHCSKSSSNSNITTPKEESDESLDIIGLHMSNWNALDEDSDENPTNTVNRQRRKRGQKMSKSETPSHEMSSNQQQQHQSSANNRSSGSTTFCQTSENEYNDAKSVAQHLDIPLHRVSFASEYWIQVFEPFIESLSSSSSSPSSPSSLLSSIGGEQHQQHQHQQGMTMPNPDYGCNTYIKFGTMKDYALGKLHADYVATGHYAQLWHRGDYLNNHRTTSSSNESSSSAFHEWMVEMSKLLEGQVLESIAGRPEEEWILNNNNLDATTTTMTMQPPPPPMLLAGADRSKDQTYFLSGVKGEAFRNVIFPLGHLAKQHHQQQSKSSDSQVVNSSSSSSNDNIHNQQTVRGIAQNAQIPTASKRDSMGICFIGKRNFGQFISQYLPERHTYPGNFIDIDTGKIVGTHDGVARYTLGEGAKISGANVRYFVCGKGRIRSVGGADYTNNNNENTVFVCNSTHHPALYSDELFVDFDSFNWIGLGGDDIGGQDSSSSSSSSVRYNHIPRPLVEGKSIRLLARVRHLQPLTGCTVTWDRRSSNTMMNNGNGSTRGYLVIRFDKAMRAITPGQIVALYAGADGLVCLGGGIIGGSGLSYLDRGMDVSTGLIHPSGNNDLSLRTAT